MTTELDEYPKAITERRCLYPAEGDISFEVSDRGGRHLSPSLWSTSIAMTSWRTPNSEGKGVRSQHLTFD